MEQVTQQRAPLLEAMQAHRLNRVVRFDVPGHKGGRGNHELAEFLGADCVRMDVNSMKNLDNLCHPVSVIRDAQQLAAEAFGAKNAFFIINGATGASQAMIFSTCKAGDKLIMPRNVHRSAINALVVNGAIPVYVDPGEQKDLGIPLGMADFRQNRNVSRGLRLPAATYHGRGQASQSFGYLHKRRNRSDC